MISAFHALINCTALLMNPLSVTGSIIAVIDTIQKVIFLCNDYRAAVKETPWELPRIIKEVGSLQNVFRSLQSLATQAENAQNATDSRIPQLKEFNYPNTGASALCFADIQTLQQKFAPAQLERSGWIQTKSDNSGRRLVTKGRLR